MQHIGMVSLPCMPCTQQAGNTSKLHAPKSVFLPPQPCDHSQPNILSACRGGHASAGCRPCPTISTWQLPLQQGAIACCSLQCGYLSHAYGHEDMDSSLHVQAPPCTQRMAAFVTYLEPCKLLQPAGQGACPDTDSVHASVYPHLTLAGFDLNPPLGSFNFKEEALQPAASRSGAGPDT